ncbi:MAG: LysR family transcriptional regulator [Coxiellaceae bacterium]|nr:LysR family transcriptional regulator [Coxiellaceae bacterium]
MRSTHLLHFIEVAEKQSMSRAAESLGLSQPSLSMSIKRLEIEVGVSLFNRHKTGMTLTPGGHCLLRQAKQLLQYWGDVKKSVNEVHTEIAGHIVFGCHSAVASYHLPQALPSLLIENKKLNIKFIHGLSREINEGIIAGRIDIGLVVNPLNHPDLVIHKIRDDRIGFWHHKDYCVDKDMTLLCDPELIQSQVLIAKLKQSCGDMRLLSSDSLLFLAELAAQKTGVAVIPQTIANSHAPLVNFKPDLFYLDNISLVYRVENRQIRSIQAIKSAVCELVSQR